MTPVTEKEDVMHALEAIQNVCLKYNIRCHDCPLFSIENRCCVINGVYPYGWKIKYTNDIWRAVK